MSVVQQFTIQMPDWKASTGGPNLVLKPPLWVPDPCPIIRTLIWMQSPDDPIPSNMIGDASVAVDIGGQYVALSGFPNAQDGLFETLITLADIQTSNPGKRSSWNAQPAPVNVSNANNDVILFCPETGINGGTDIDVQMLVGFQFLAESNIIIPVGTKAYNITLDSNGIDGAGIGFRNVLTSTQTVAGSQIRVRVSSLAGDGGLEGLNLSAASVGLQSGSTSSMQAAPVPLTFQGQRWVQIPPDNFAWSDWVPLATAPGSMIMAHFDLFGGATGNMTAYPNAWAYKATAVDGNFNSPVAGANSQAMPGTVTWQPNRTHVMDQIQIQ